MALLSGFDQLDPANNTFSDWLNKTNEIVLMVRGDTTGAQTSIMTANSQLGGSQTFGNATLFGQFMANTMVVLNDGGNDGTDDSTFANVNFGGLRGGIWNNISNTITADTLYIVSNTTYTNESNEVYVNSTYGLIVENTTELRYDVLYVGDGPAGSNTNAQLHWQSSNNQLNFNDDVRATFGGASGTEVFGGTGQYEMFYSAADNRMYSNTDKQDIRSTANLNLITDRYELRTETGGENMMTANLNGEVVLYWDNAARVTTNSYGITVHGDAILEDDLVIFDGNKILMGGNTTYDGTQDLTTYKFQMFTDGSDAFIKADDRDLYVEVNQGFELTNIGRGTHYMTANAAGQNEVSLYAAGTKRLETIDGASDGNSVDGVEIYGEANTNTLRVQSDANFDNTTLNSNSVHWDASLEIWNYRDNVKATWGDGDDLEVYYTGTRGNVNTDILDVRGSTNTNIFTDDFEMRSQANNELMLTANVANGVELYWDGIKKVSSNTHGVEVYGQVIADNGFVTYNNQPIEMGGANYAAAHNFTIVTDGTDTTITETSNDLSVRVEDNFRVTDDTGATSLIVANTSGEVTLYHNNNQKMQTNAYGVEITGEANTGTLRVRGDAAFDGSGGLDSNTLNWESANNILNWNDSAKATFGDGDDLQVWHDGTDSWITENGSGSLYIQANNFVLEDTNGTDYISMTAGAGVTVTHAGAVKITTTAIGVNIEGEANTDTLRVQSTSDLEDDIRIQGSNNTDTLTWDKSANTLNFDDNNYITLGTSADFTMHHDGSNTYLTEVGSGELHIQANNIHIENTDGNEYFLGIAGAGAALHFAGTQKLITTNIGVDIEGQANTDTLRVQSTTLLESDVFFDGTSADALHWESANDILNFNDNVKATFGAGDDLQIYHDGSVSYIDDLGTGNLLLRTNGSKIALQDYNGGSPITMLQAFPAGRIDLNYSGATKLATTSTGINVTGTVVGTGLDINGSADLGASGSDTISMIGVVDTDIVPTGTVDLGTSAAPWTDLWVTNADVQTLQVDLNATIDGDVSANSFAGDGSLLTSLDGSQITTGTVAAARIDSELSSNTSGIAAKAEDLEINSTGADQEFRVTFTANSGAHRDVFADSGLLYNPADKMMYADNLTVNTQINMPNAVQINTGNFQEIVVANTATILTLSVTTLEANGVAFTGTGDDVSTPNTPTVIDSFAIGTTQGYKYFVHGEDLADNDSGYAVEINVIVTDNNDIFYTRYGEVENNMSDVVIVPAVAANNTHIDLKATCGSASGSNIHRFKVLKIETRP